MDEIIKNLSEALLKIRAEDGSFRDPVSNLLDFRPSAEIAKSLLYLGKKEDAQKTFDWLVKNQNVNGSWNEVHPDLNEESTVATSIIGNMLLRSYFLTDDSRYLESSIAAGEYVLSKEFSPGYFIKSYYHYGDILNVNATCAAFLYNLFKATDSKRFIEARDRAIYNTVRYQFKDGAYPYSSPIRTFPYEWHLNVRDPHYHAITLYFLLLSDPVLENKYLSISVNRAIEWLESCTGKGGVNWAMDKMMFSLGVTGCYGYAAYCFNYFKKEQALKNVISRLKDLQINGAYERYEPTDILQTLKGTIGDLIELEHRSNTEYPLPVRARQMVRRMRRDLIERRKRKFSCYYSAQILDCLTEIIYNA